MATQEEIMQILARAGALPAGFPPPPPGPDQMGGPGTPGGAPGAPGAPGAAPLPVRTRPPVGNVAGPTGPPPASAPAQLPRVKTPEEEELDRLLGEEPEVRKIGKGKLAIASILDFIHGASEMNRGRRATNPTLNRMIQERRRQTDEVERARLQRTRIAGQRAGQARGEQERTGREGRGRTERREAEDREVGRQDAEIKRKVDAAEALTEEELRGAVGSFDPRGEQDFDYDTLRGRAQARAWVAIQARNFKSAGSLSAAERARNFDTRQGFLDEIGAMEEGFHGGDTEMFDERFRSRFVKRIERAGLDEEPAQDILAEFEETLGVGFDEFNDNQFTGPPESFGGKLSRGAASAAESLGGARTPTPVGPRVSGGSLPPGLMDALSRGGGAVKDFIGGLLGGDDASAPQAGDVSGTLQGTVPGGGPASGLTLENIMDALEAQRTQGETPSALRFRGQR